MTSGSATRPFVPPGQHVISFSIATSNAAAAVDFYKAVFGAVETMRFTGPNGKIGHVQLQIGDSRFSLADEDRAYNCAPTSIDATTVQLHVFVENADETIQRAVAHGAKITIAAHDEFYGDRTGRIMDPFGHVWIVATHLEDVSLEEMQRRFLKLYGG